MTAILTVLYPSGPDVVFDMEYYNTKHMPMLLEMLREYGCKKYSVYKAQPGPNTPYNVQTIVEFDSMVKLGAGLQAVGKQLVDDVPNFSNKSSISFVSEEVATAE